MFKIESYVTPILLSYVDKYVRDFKPADAQVSLWGGGVALHNLVLKADVLQQEVALPFTLVSGRIHELLIQVPWTKIMSEPIVVTIDTIECILSLHPPAASDENVPPESPSRKAQVVEAPPGYMQALVRRIVSNISLRVHHLIVKYVQDDVVLSLNVKHLSVESAGHDWQAAFADIDQRDPLIRRLIRLDDLTLCLDRADSDGKIRFYQEPLLYRCQLDLRVLTRLVSANTRRASNLSIQLRSTKLAWGVTSEQLTLLLRLLRERTQDQINTPPPAPKHSAVSLAPPHATSSNSAEPVHTGSWSEWAWSWLPTWMDKEGGVEEATLPPTPIPIFFAAYFDHISLVFKVMETDSVSRKRARGVLELIAAHAAVRATACAPTALRMRIGARTVRLLSHGKCICGQQEMNVASEEPTIYLDRKNTEQKDDLWSWPPEIFEDKIETAEVAEEEHSKPPNEQPSRGEFPSVTGETQHATSATPQANMEENEEPNDELWHLMSPVIFLDYTHVRSPPSAVINPYDSPPTDFQFSDWEEDNNLKISIRPLDIKITIGLVHRLSAVRLVFQDLTPVPVPDIPMKTLTVEECDALFENLPQRRINIDIRGLRVRMIPWDHSLAEKQAMTPLVLDIEFPQARLIASGPLYPHRVCSAACQMPKDEGPLWQGARMHVSATLSSIEVKLCSLADAQTRPVARADLRFIVHMLLHPEMFARRESVLQSYNIKIQEINTCGSPARLQAAWQVVESLVAQKPSVLLRHTMLAKDALSDEESVAIDATIEELAVRGFISRHMNTHTFLLQTARVMAFYSPSEGTLKQAWLFSGPDSSTPACFLRVAVQWGDDQFEDSLDYVGIWLEPFAMCVDPLLIAWLAYKPQMKTPLETFAGPRLSSQFNLRRRSTPPSSSGRGASRTGSGSELVHAVRTRSVGSSSEPGEQRRTTLPQLTKETESGMKPELLFKLYERMRRMLINVELGLSLIYFTMSSASAVDCATLTDAMERHAAVAHHVLAFSTGRISISSNAMMKHLWNDIRHDGPTFKARQTDDKQERLESFPWKLCLADVSCYTVEAREIIDSGRERASGLRSQLKASTGPITTRIVLESVTTTVTLSVVTKSMQIRSWLKPPEQAKVAGPTSDEMRVKYFTTGVDFKPSTLKEFVRGPARRRNQSPEPQPRETKPQEPTETTTKGPVVSIGIHLHADTPPVTLRLEQDQVHTVAAALHCLNHLNMLLHRTPQNLPRYGYTSSGGSHRSLIRSVSEIEEQQSPSDENLSESRSELVPIFESHAIPEVKLKKFFWFQWVVGRATLVVSSRVVKLAFDADDIISTVDLQEHYNQLKVKIASASVRHHKKNSNDEWAAGVLGGRVLEAREPINAKEENHFLAVTITQAQISNLPASWKEELHPKLLQQKSGVDSMWEIYATLAPLEAVLQPAVLENIITLAQEMAPPSFCPLETEIEERVSTWQWPFCYITAGGLRLLIITDHKDQFADDTFLFIVGKISVSPHPENPICRRAVSAAMDSGWVAGGSALEGRQYEVFIKSFAVQSAPFNQIAQQEASQMHNLQGTGSENPALKWTQPVVSPAVTPILHAVEINCVLAPALFMSGALVCGPALEFNLASDCAVELSLEQLTLIYQMVADAKAAVVSSYESSMSLVDRGHGVCPYAALVVKQKKASDSNIDASNTNLIEEDTASAVGYDRSFGADSGVDLTMSKTSRLAFDIPKKSVSIAFTDEPPESSDYLEVFVTMGMIELSLYVGDDNSPEVIALRPPRQDSRSSPAADAQVKLNQEKDTALNVDDTNVSITSRSRSRSLTETVRNADIGQTKLELNTLQSCARKGEGNLPLVHMTLHQPNLYYWKKKMQTNLQVSLFNAWIGLGGGPVEGFWSEAIFSTAKGVPDPVTDIPPALATVKIVVPTNAGGTPYLSSTTTSKGTMSVDIERPVLLEVSEERIRRLQIITDMIQSKMEPILETGESSCTNEMVDLPLLYKLRKSMVGRSIESITIQASQLGVSGSDGTIGWDSASLQIATGLRPQRLTARGLVTALLVAAGPPGDCRHVVLQPLMLGLELESTWEAWRRIEGGASGREPSVRVGIDLDRVTIDVRPGDLTALCNIQETVNKLFGEKAPTQADSADSINSVYSMPMKFTARRGSPKRTFERHLSASSIDSTEFDDHYYKDDLKSGAFKIVVGGQLPMAYQVTLHGSTVSWRYPHPRTITRIMLFPIPGVDEEVNCILELYNFLLRRWVPHTYLKLPVLEPQEFKLYVAPPDAVFDIMWRFRAYAETENDEPPFEFKIQNFMPRADPLMIDRGPETPSACDGGVSAEQLSGALRVDSYFAPRLLPRMRLALRFTELELNLHNSLPYLSSQATALEGYYVSRPLMRSHRVLSLIATDSAAHAHFGSPAGQLLLLDTKLSCDILECTTGTLEQVVGPTRLRAAVSVPADLEPRVRAFCDAVRVAIHVPRLRTLRALADDWRVAIEKFKEDSNWVADDVEKKANLMTKAAVADAAAIALEGRVSLWLHNSCASALRIGQEGTDEIVPLGPGARLAYRWRSPNAPLRLRFALAGPAANWHWSTSLPLSVGVSRVRLEDAESLGGMQTPGGGVFLHAHVEASGARRSLQLAGRLVLANVLRRPLLYKVRARCTDAKFWRSVCSGELDPESVGRSVLCGADCEMVLKIKFTTNDTGWSGDIPLKECPKENVPWLVKVPNEGETAYVSVWCRVVRARADSRVLAAVWPLYVLYSHLPLDTDVLVMTDTELSTPELAPIADRPAPLVQTTPGRGACTHLLAPGTTAARHQLSFQYKDIECPVTRESIPLHYGVTDTSVFDKRAPVNNIEEVVDDIRAWFERSGRGATSQWPYSLVAKHWSGEWQPAKLQPRCDVTVRYGAVRAGGGCSLEIQLCPVVLLCNASPLSLTLRAHDAAPLCKVEPGAAISAPSAVLRKPFFMSVEVGRETFVSSQLQVWAEEPGRYGAPPPGYVALDHAAAFAIQCNQKAALLTLYYEVKEEINVLGISPTFVLINRLHTNLMASAIAVPIESAIDPILQPKTFKLVKPTKEESINGEPMSRFWVSGRWRGGDPGELRAFLCLALSAGAYPAHAPVPVRLGVPPVRRAVCLVDERKESMAVVVVQQKHEGRWLVTVAPDPCPQFVVHNRSCQALAVAQPECAPEDDTTLLQPTQVVPECAGARWWCVVEAGAVAHYSTPAHNARFPPPPGALPHNIPFLTIGRDTSVESEPEWSAGVAVAGGEQLLQLSGGATVKLRVHPHPHSTLLELLDVDQNDISASDIRRRLQGFLKDSFFSLKDVPMEKTKLDRVSAMETLLTQSENINKVESTGQLLTPPATTLESVPEQCHTNNVEENVKWLNKESPEDPGQTDKLQTLNNVNDRTNPSTTSFAEKGQVFYYDPNDDRFPSVLTLANVDVDSPQSSFVIPNAAESEWDDNGYWCSTERLRCVIGGIAIEMAVGPDVSPLFALHVDRAAVLLQSDVRGTRAVLSIADVQVDNLQYESGQYDFGVVASTRASPLARDVCPPLWSALTAAGALTSRQRDARLLLRLRHDRWRVVTDNFYELTEVELSAGPLALYVEDSYVAALARLARAARPAPARDAAAALAVADARALQHPLRLRTLRVHPLDLTLTLHTAVRMYIALDQSPLRLSAFQQQDMMTSAEHLTHALTVHYLSAAILGAGWVVGGLELLGAPGALAARVGGATGGVRGVAAAAAAALLRSLSAWAGSLARNLDLLAGDEEHARRAAAARRRPPDSFMAGLAAGITNFAINILGAVGGLAHHPLVGVVVGETESGAAALRRSLLGALTKPLSATADLLAFAGTGLLRQTGWDPVPQPRAVLGSLEGHAGAGWRRDCVRWAFRLAELTALTGFDVLLDGAPLRLLLTHKFLVVADPESERIVEMIDLRFCTLGPYQGTIVELMVAQRRQKEKVAEARAVDEDDEYQISAAAMARVARYTGAAGGAPAPSEARVLSLLPPPRRSPALHAALAAAIHHNADSHLHLL